MSIIYLVLNWAKLWCGFHAIIYVKQALFIFTFLFFSYPFLLSFSTPFFLFYLDIFDSNTCFAPFECTNSGLVIHKLFITLFSLVFLYCSYYEDKILNCTALHLEIILISGCHGFSVLFSRSYSFSPAMNTNITTWSTTATDLEEKKPNVKSDKED